MTSLIHVTDKDTCTDDQKQNRDQHTKKTILHGLVIRYGIHVSQITTEKRTESCKRAYLTT